MLKSIQAESPAPEVLFAQKYAWLLQWALHFSQGDQARAEDLVQDTFVRFAVSESELRDPERIEPLLYTYLKFTHLSHIRRLQRYPEQELPLVDFYSIHLAMREAPSVDPIEMQDTLRRLVAFLIWRKERTKCASILLLRFFHGYRKDEIMRIGLVSDRVVANGLMLARTEARSYLNVDRDLAQSIHQSVPPILFPKCTAVPHEQLLKELRQSIFEARQGTCLPKDELLSRYHGLNPKPIECKLLAHIVSCERCLDLVCKYFDVPPLSGRSPEDMAEGGRRTRLGLRMRGTGDGGPHRILRVAEQRLAELYEHQPKKLRVVVNGRLVASRDVSSPTCKLEVEVGRETRVECVEIYSEQGICLLAMAVDAVPPEAPPEIRRHAKLKYGRSMEMVLRFTSVGPFVDISYSDPSLVTSGSNIAEEEAEELEDLETDIGQQTEKPVLLPVAGIRSATGFLFRWRSQIWPFGPPRMKAVLMEALILGLVSLLCLFLFLKQRPINVTANALLVKAEAWDPAVTKSNQKGVVRQKVRFRMRQTTFEHTLYQDAQGVRVPKPPVLSAGEQQLASEFAHANVSWEDPLSAAAYQGWHDSQRSRQDEITRSGNNLLTLKTTVPDGEVAQESITVRESDFHPVERTVRFRNNDTVEIAELEYAVLPWQPNSEGLFEPIAANHTGGGMHRVTASRLQQVLSEEKLDEAELSALLALHQVGADTSERMELVRTPSGIQVKGIVATEARKEEIENHLHLLQYVIPAIFTFQELQSGKVPTQPETSIKLSSTVAELTPLQQYLLAKGLSREEVGGFADQLFDDSASVSQGSKAIDGLMTRFAADNLSGTARAALAQLVESHREKILKTLAAEERLIRQTGIAVPSSPTVSADASSNFKQAAERNIALCRELVGNGITRPRPAEVIVPELLASAEQLRVMVLRISVGQPAEPTEQ